MPAIRTDTDSDNTALIECPEEGCHYQATRKGNLRRHFDCTHATGPKRYQCVWKGCSYADMQKSNFDDHMNIHLKRKPYGCPDCILMFANRGGLHHHRSVQHNYVSPVTRRRSTVHQDAPANPELVSQPNPSPPVTSVGKPRPLPYPFKRRATVQDQAKDTQNASTHLPFGPSYLSPPSSATSTSSTSSSSSSSSSNSSTSSSSTSSTSSAASFPTPFSSAPTFPIPPPTTRQLRRLAPYPPPPPGIFRVFRLKRDIPPLRALLRTPASAWSLPAVNFDIAMPRKFTLPPISDLFKVAESRSQT